MGDALGKITFERDDGEIGLRLQWNPDKLSASERKAIAQVLAHISWHIRRDMFEEDGTYVEMPPANA